MRKLLIIFLIVSGSTAAQPVPVQRINHIEEIMIALIKLPGTIYQDGVFKNAGSVTHRFFDEQVPELTKEQWGEVINELFNKGYKREQIQIVSPYRIGATCPTKCPGTN